MFDLETNALIVINKLSSQTDVKYNHNGNKVAVSDSEGNVVIYQRHQDNFIKAGAFKA